MEMQDKTIATIGRCIYCGKTDQSLSDEHIVPYGLNGEWILGRASCKGCRQITSGFETDVQRNCLLETRAKLGLRTRGRHNRPKEFSLFVKRDHQEEEIRVPIQEHLTLMMLPLFKLPAYLDERPYQKGIDLVVPPTVVQIGGPPIEEIGKKYRPQSLRMSVGQRSTLHNSIDLDQNLSVNLLFDLLTSVHQSLKHVDKSVLALHQTHLSHYSSLLSITLGFIIIGLATKVFLRDGLSSFQIWQTMPLPWQEALFSHFLAREDIFVRKVVQSKL